MTDHFSAQFTAAAHRLSTAEPVLWDGLREAIRYLTEFRHGAISPDVRWGIAQSAFGVNCGEIRWPDPEIQREHPDHAWRGLFVAHPNDVWYVFTILGNKARVGNAWYDEAVPVSDALAVQAIAKLGLASIDS